MLIAPSCRVALLGYKVRSGEGSEEKKTEYYMRKKEAGVDVDPCEGIELSSTVISVDGIRIAPVDAFRVFELRVLN